MSAPREKRGHGPSRHTGRVGPLPQVVAHRGASEDLAEHTLSAYEFAIDCGADALEADVRLTRDGHLVCVHDRRVDRTSDGRGPVSTLELAELAQLDFASWRSQSPGLPGMDPDEAPDADTGADSRILTLRRLFEVVADCDRRVELAVETKHPTRYAGLVEQKLIALLDHFGWAGPGSHTAEPPPVRIMSFSQVSLRRVHRLAPGLPTVQLMSRLPVVRDAVLPPWLWAVGPSIDGVREAPSLVSRMHRRGLQVHVWTVDRSDDVALCLDLGVDAIITNRPALVIEHLDRYAF